MAQIIALINTISSARGKGGGGVPPSVSSLRQETGDALLLEDGGLILLEQQI
jgi:hypothetical protein